VDTIRRGNAAVLNALIRADLSVLVPFGEGCPYDLMVDTGLEQIRVQVKCGRVRNECIEFDSAATDQGRGRQDRARADVFGVHVPQLDRVFIVPVSECARFRGYLWLTAARNNQQRRVKYASDYAVEA